MQSREVDEIVRAGLRQWQEWTVRIMVALFVAWALVDVWNAPAMPKQHGMVKPLRPVVAEPDCGE